MAVPLIMPFRDVNALINANRDLPVTYINDNDSLVALCARWRQQKAIALDTEFIRERTFYPILGLIQAADREGIYLIDPLADLDFSPFSAVLTDESITKVFHACGEDLDVFAYFCGVLPTPIFDTQVAAAYCGMDTQMGYQRLVFALYDIDLGKHETRSDWLQRPLSEGQLSYAVEDVRFLLDIHQVLTGRLEKKERLAWVEEECQGLIRKGRSSDAAQTYYLKFRNACHFSTTQQRLLQALCMWREEEARHRDQPRGFILQESCLLPIAEAMPESETDLRGIQGLGKREMARYGEIILSLVKQVRAQSPAAEFEMIPAPLRKESKPLLDGLKKASSNKAKTLGLKPELLLRRKTLEGLLQKLLKSKTNDWQDELQGWRAAILLPLLSAEISRQAVLVERLQSYSRSSVRKEEE